jgi:hypothetical protein
MTGRDRMVVMVLAVLAVLAGGWLLLVSPERSKSVQAEAEVQTARQQLASAQAEVSSARDAQAQYTTAYTSMVSIGQAVPPAQETPALVYELDQASNGKGIDFNSISTGTTSGSGSSASAPAAAAAAAAATPAAFTPMPFTFVFKGSYYGLYHLIEQLNGFVQRTTAGGVHVRGRLLTIQGADITLENKGGTASGGSQSAELTATVTATAYVLPAGQGLTGSATPAGPAGTSASQTTSSSSSPSSPTTSAVVRVNP